MNVHKNAGLSRRCRIGAFIFLFILSELAVNARLIQDYEHKVVIATPAGWLGAIDWREGDGDYRARVFCGPLELSMPGTAGVLVWAIPMVCCMIILSGVLALLLWKKHPRWLGVVVWGMLGCVYGLSLLFLGELDFGLSNWNHLGVYAKAPFSVASSKLYIAHVIGKMSPTVYRLQLGWCTWCLVGSLFAFRDRRWARCALRTLLVISYATGCLLFSLMWFNTVEHSDWRGILREAVSWPWVISWGALYLSGQIYLWRKIAASGKAGTDLRPWRAKM